MFAIKAELIGSIPPKAQYSIMTIDEIYNHLEWEANLTIVYNGQCFFKEEISIIEFYWHLNKWYQKYLSGDVSEFVYSTIEHIEPILVFSFNNNYWEIDSIWKLGNEPVFIEDRVFYYEIEKFIHELWEFFEH